MCLCLPLLYLSVFDTGILPKTQTDFLWTCTCFLLAAVDSCWCSWLLNTHMHAHMCLVLFLLQTLSFSDFFKNHIRNGSREENHSLQLHSSVDSYKIFSPTAWTATTEKTSSWGQLWCASQIPALPLAGSAPTAGSSMWAGSLKQLENEPSSFILLHGHHSPEGHPTNHNDFPFLPSFLLGQLWVYNKIMHVPNKDTLKCHSFTEK